MSVKSSPRRTARGPVRAELQRVHVHTFPGPAGTSGQGTELTVDQKAILTALGLPDPPRGPTATPA